ncbi:MAG: hypothetical protein NVSMB4_05820 [Acidimicrobiales bacterium]
MTLTESLVDELTALFEADGFVVVPHVLADAELDALQADMEALQRAAAAGQLAPEHAGDVLVGAFDGERPPYVHYVMGVTKLSLRAAEAFAHPLLAALLERILGPEAYLWDYNGHGVVYQDARPGPEMTYSRIGWHSDHQSRPTSDIWPGVALTFHFDETSPANGFLRVVPGSHRRAPEGMPAGFEKVPGEIGVYCDRGDVMLHHSDLWHSAARATEDPPGGVRRHLRGTVLGGRRLGADEELEPFNKNAAR